MRGLIINADGYGFTAGVTRAIEECVHFGTLRSLSANVNFRHADRLATLVKNFPQLSVGCHLNPVVGGPVLPAHRVSSLLSDDGEFFYREFARCFICGRIRRGQLRAEMFAQAEKTRDLAGEAFSHVDFHMGLHRLPGLYELFLQVAEKFAVRIRTHRYRVGLESAMPRLSHYRYLATHPSKIVTLAWNQLLRQKALGRGLAMPDRWVEVTARASQPEAITVHHYLRLLANLPAGYNEFVVHPGYVDDDLKRWSTYLAPRDLERRILLNPTFRNALLSSDVKLLGYRDIPVRHRNESLEASRCEA